MDLPVQNALIEFLKALTALVNDARAKLREG